MPAEISPPSTFRRPKRLSGTSAMTLAEVMIAFAILALTSVGGVSGFLLLNRYAENNRSLSLARALCQERIEQAQTLPYRPTDATPTLPSAPSSDPSNTAACTILGTAANYKSGVYSGGSNLQTSSETIPIYSYTSGVSGGAAVTYKRTTAVSPAALTYYNGTTSAATTTSLNLLQFTVAISYVYRGKTYGTSMTTLRGPD